MVDTKVSLFKELFPVSATSYKLSQEKCNVKLKLLDKWGDRILNDLTGLFGVPGDHLHLSTAVEQGCIIVTWLCSSTYIKELKGAIINATDVLQTKGVLQVIIGEELVLECPQPDKGTSCNHHNFYEITLYSDCIADIYSFGCIGLCTCVL